MTKSVLSVGVALAALMGAPSFAAAEICVPESDVSQVQQDVSNEEATSPAHARFELHFASLGAETGSRILSDGSNMSRPVRIVSADEFKLDWRR